MDENTNNEQYMSSYATQASQNPGGTPVKPKKSHTGLIVTLSIVGVLVLGAAAAFIFAKDIIVNKYMLMTKSDVEYFRWVAGREVDAACDSFEKAGSKTGTKNSLFPEEGQGTMKTSIKAELSQAFTDMLNIYPVKEIRFDTDAAFAGNTYSMSFSPYYNGNRLFVFNALLDTDAVKMEAELPDYKEGVVDLSSFLKQKIQDDKTTGALIAEYVDELREAAGKNEFDAEKFCKQYRRYTDTLIDSIEKVELNTDAYVGVGSDTVKCTEIRISLSGKELKDQLKSISRLFMEDYGDEINSKLFGNSLSGNSLLTEGDIYNKISDEMPINPANGIKQEDIDKAIDEISDDVSGKLILYVNNKADLIAIDAKGSYNSTAVGFKIRWEKALSGIKGKIGISLNQINAVDIGFEVSRSAGRQNFHLNIVPDSFVDSFLGDYKGFSLDIDLTSEAYANTSIFTVKKDGNAYVTISTSTSTEAFSGQLLDEGGKTKYPADTITKTDFISIPDAVRFGIGILDKIDEPVLEEKIDELLSKNLPGFTVSSLREMIKDGTIDKLFGSYDPGDLIDDTDDNTGDDLGDNPGDGINDDQTGDDGSGTGDIGEGTGTENGEDGADENLSGYPTARVVTPVEYPAETDIYYYSYAELADYAIPGQYKGRVFKMPEAQEVTQETFEEAKKAYLESFENVILVDQSTAVVEMGDEVYLDIMPYLYGVAIEAYHFTDSYAKIGEYSYGEGLDDQIVGMKVGESKDITTKLGSQFGDFAGIEATFKVTVTQIDRYMKPEWTEEFVCGGLGFESLEACDEALMERLVEQAEVSNDEMIYTLIEEAKMETVYSDIPEELHDKLWNRYYNEVYDMTESFGQTPEEYFGGQGLEAAELYEMMDEDVEMNVPDYCFYAAVAKAENICISGEELIGIIDDYMGYYGYDTFEELIKNVRLDLIIDYEIETRIGQLILDNAVIQPNE
ncbi:MAG: hypothetical protein K6E85_10755 [Lachnospiraceae bacterium]|nr:hypothetical protein [Lachnospiraceae bacterium]